jgi:hypothetical protein
MTSTAAGGSGCPPRLARRSSCPFISTSAVAASFFQYLVPVHVEVEKDRVTCVTVIDEALVRDSVVVEGDATYLTAAVAASDDGQPWPSWRFGY